MTIKTSSFGSGGGLPRLAPDLSYPSSKAVETVTYKLITGIDGSSGLVTALSGSNKYAVSVLIFSSMTNEDYNIVLTVGGEEIWNDTVTITTGQLNLLGVTAGTNLSNSNLEGAYEMSDFSLEIQSTTDTSVALTYLMREIK